MKILQLCKKFPYPPKDGESIAVGNLAKSLTIQGGELTLLAMNTRKHFYRAEKWPDTLKYYQEIHATVVDNRIKLKEAFINLFRSESYHVARFVSPSFQKKLIELLKQTSFDVIQLETLYLAPYIPTIRKYSKAVIAMRAHNVEHEIWQRIAQNTKLLPKRWYLNHLTEKLRKYEYEQLANYDVLLPITQRDLEIFRSMGYRKKAIVVPIGVNASDYQPRFDTFHRQDLSLSFIGALDWMPNQEGLIWFLDKIWGPLSNKFPELKLHVAGRNTPEWISAKKIRNVIFHGEVPSATDFINQHPIMVVPLLSGSGMRAKILEGMALGKVVVTTSLGLEGIAAQNKKEVLVADDPDEFLAAFEYCHRQNGQLELMGRKAQRFVNERYDHLVIAKQLMETYASLMVEAI